MLSHAVFDIQPTSRNASLNDNAEVTFTCSAKEVEFVYWDIDGYSPSSVVISDRGIKEETFYDSTSDLSTSVVTVSCSALNNNTRLQCILAVEGVTVNKSHIALLLIQGKLNYIHVSIFYSI